jgi:VirK protein
MQMIKRNAGKKMVGSRLLGVTACCLCLSAGVDRDSAIAVAQSAESSYAEVISALQTAKPVKLLTDLGQCQYENTGKPGPSLQSGLSINAFIVLPGRGVFFSDVHQTLNEANLPVTEYVRYNLTTDNQLKVRLTHLENSAAIKQDVIVCLSPLGARFVW